MSTRIFLVRHGETEWNALRRIQGHRDVTLNDTGLAQAARAAEYLAGEPLAAVYSSDLIRASQTAEAIAREHGLPVIPDAGLREAHFGEWEGLDHEQMSSRYPEEYARWREDSVANRPPGGENISDLLARASAVFDRVAAAHPGQTVAIVAHGGPIRAIVLHALCAPLEAYPRLRMRNASVSLIEIGKRGPVLALYDHACHWQGRI